MLFQAMLELPGFLMVWYFAFGRNMNREVLLKRGVSFSRECRAVLEGFRLVFNKGGGPVEGEGFANIVPERGSVVEGVVFETGEEGLCRLDSFEKVPEHYRRGFVSVRLDSGECFYAVAYFAVETTCQQGLKPSKEYLTDLIKGAKQHGLSEQWVKRLEGLLERTA